MIIEAIVILAVIATIGHLIYTMWKIRKEDALKRRGLYHGLGRHDEDWEV